MEKKIKYYDIGISDIPFIEYTNIFVGNLTWINRGVYNSIATYDLVVREIPKDWGFYIMDGLERFTDYLLQFKFDSDAIKTLKEMGLINSSETEEFYKNFKFNGDVLALPEGTIFFPGEPMVRITAPLAVANMLTAFSLNVFGYPVRSLTKLARMKIATKDRKLSGLSTVRFAGFEQSIWNIRGNLLLNKANLSASFTPITYRKFTEIIPTGSLSANVNHAFVKSFPTEVAAYRYVLDVLQPRASLFLVMIDTYGLRQGLKNFIYEAKKTANFSPEKFYITLDSGNLLEESVFVRKELNQAGFSEIKIQAFSNLDEYKIENLIESGAPIDYFIGSTEPANITDNPKFEAVYKMAELRHSDGTIEQKAKLAEGKQSLPGQKQVFRVYNKDGQMVEDVIGLENEQLGKSLLVPVIIEGKQVYYFPGLDVVKEKIQNELGSLPDKYKKIRNPDKYPVHVSDKLQNLFDQVKKQHG